ncbi:MAG: hypothetical protein AAF741_16880 [Bacteroidota bacterium]
MQLTTGGVLSFMHPKGVFALRTLEEVINTSKVKYIEKWYMRLQRDDHFRGENRFIGNGFGLKMLSHVLLSII